MTINDTWGYAKNDTNWKSAEALIHNLIDSASKGGNFLLNVGPTAEGEFPEAIHERLARMGEWIKINGQSIYATRRSPFRTLSFDGRVTTKGTTLYLHVFKWPDEGLKLAGLETPALGARALDGGERLSVTPAGTDANGHKLLAISKPTKVDPVATVIELRLAAPPAVADAEPVAKPEADGSFLLKASDAEIHGRTALYEVSGLNDYIGSWQDREDYVTWKLEVPAAAAGRYRVQVNYSSEARGEGSAFTVGLEGGLKAAGLAKPTGSWHTFQNLDLGEIQIPAGNKTLEVRITRLPQGAAMNLHQIRLSPVR